MRLQPSVREAMLAATPSLRAFALSKLLPSTSADKFGPDHTTRAILTAGGRG